MARILVIDDSAEDRAVIRDILVPPGYDVVESDTISPDMAGLQTANLVVLDPCIALAAGEHIVKQIKSQRPRLPVIVVSMKGNEELVIQALQNGAVSYVPKKLLEQELLRTVRYVLEIAGEHESKGRLLKRRCEMSCKFVLENDRQFISCVVDHLQQCCAEFGLFEESNELTRVGMALDEALANAMMHGNLEVSSTLRDEEGNDYEETAKRRAKQPKYRDRHIRVAASFNQEGAEFIIQDDGPGFDHTSILDPTDPRHVERVSGRGVLLMRTFMDEVTFNKKGNCVTMRKLRVKSAT